MASGATNNYNLNQWKPSDRILMTDFNGDNVKIDAALNKMSESIPYQKILTVTTQAAAQQIDVTVSQIDFTRYHKIELFVDCPALASNFFVRVNGDGGSTYSYQGITGDGGGSVQYANFLATFKEYSYGVLLFYAPVQTGRVGCLTACSNANSYSGRQTLAAATWGALSTFNFVSTQAFPIGTKIAIFGVKK